MEFCLYELVDILHNLFSISYRGVRRWAESLSNRKVLFITLVIHCAIAFSLCVCTIGWFKKNFLPMCFTPRGLNGVFWCKNNPCKFFFKINI